MSQIRACIEAPITRAPEKHQFRPFAFYPFCSVQRALARLGGSTALQAELPAKRLELQGVAQGGQISAFTTATSELLSPVQGTAGRQGLPLHVDARQIGDEPGRRRASRWRSSWAQWMRIVSGRVR